MATIVAPAPLRLENAQKPQIKMPIFLKIPALAEKIAYWRRKNDNLPANRGIGRRQNYPYEIRKHRVLPVYHSLPCAQTSMSGNSVF